MRDIDVVIRRIQNDLPVTDEELSAAREWAKSRNSRYPPLTVRRFVILVSIGLAIGLFMLCNKPF
jgi:hypothetical protein